MTRAVVTRLAFALKQAYLSSKPSIDLFPDWPEGHGTYKIIYKEYADMGKMIRYYEECTDDCTGKVTKEFLFETEGNIFQEKIIMNIWSENKNIGFGK
ncbi:hypothetical protein HTZ97_09475 [Desulfuromonas acetoxidans]|uniref:Uncharacterized protein n=1 Tax=Desulfuromonas acetoxidans (strain DSM 684 / 11070) TaxID=281689 RepID=Q1K2A1_DESA6|nr:hypothetical protein [Desulfuromonas acetoxidans]EAT16538.1 hypothetical protein Dace_2633 [Desulfuromonas acetoxidans DSM 684]MBF0647051.1 hypothetical protein [Desulfuromonas acetoxidans]NVD24649.1 hypothetical protein [Desulfuromonas acetoxidans]NVE16694.1 hypothetical protein [Desulfuromonas acetoxidans]